MSTRKIILIFLLVLHFSCAFCNSENLRFVRLDVNQGLSNNSVNCFIEDHLGFMWIGTEDGLNKYDGLTYKVYRHDKSRSSIDNNKINCVLEDSKHHILIGTNQGFNVFDRSTNTFKNFIINAPVNAIFEDSKNNIWFGTDHGELHLFDMELFKSKVYFNDEVSVHLSTNAVNAITEDNKGNLFIGRGGNGLNQFNINALKFTNSYKHDIQKNSIYDNNVHALFFDKTSNTLWIGSNKSLDQFDITQNSFKNYNYKVGDAELKQVRSIINFNANKIWVGTEGNGAFIFDLSTRSFQNIKSDPLNINGLSNDQIIQLYHDRQGNIWVGCYRGGINLLIANNEFSFYQARPGVKNTLNNNIILSVLEDKNNNLWIGTDGGGLNFLDRKTGKYSFYKKGGNGLSDNTIFALFEDKKGRIWIGTQAGGLNILDPVSNTFSHFKDPDSINFRGSNDIRAIAGDHDGNVWVATNGNGINKFNVMGQRLANFRTDWQNRDYSLVTNWIRSLYVDSNNMIWVGSVAGISILDPVKKTFTNVYLDKNDSHGNPDLTIYAIAEGQKNTFWIGTVTGLKKFDTKTKTFQTYSTQEGLPDNIINGIIRDEKNQLWVSTNNGLCKFNPENGKTINFDYSDGLPANIFINNSFFKSRKGDNYFGSINGLLFFNPDSIRDNTYLPTISLTDFRIFNKSTGSGEYSNLLKKDISVTREINIRYDQSFFSFEFTAPNYMNPKKMKYRYILEGFDKDWIYNGVNNTATYTNIPPGHYTFKVSNAIDNSTWNPRVASVAIVIAPPFWLTFWAYSLYLLIFLGILYLLRRFIIYKEQIKNELNIEKVKAEKAMELSGFKLNFFTNVSHEFKTPLTLITGPIERLISGEPSEEKRSYYYHLIHRNSLRLLRLINEVLDINKIDAGNFELNSEETDVVQFIKNIKESFKYLSEQKNIQLKFIAEHEELIVPFDADKLEKVFINLLSNAFKFTNENGQVTIKLEKYLEYNKYVVIRVEDNGSGIHPQDLPHIYERFFKAKNEKSNIDGTGIGLAFVKELIELHHGKIEVESQLNKGTIFTLYLPMSDSAQEVDPDQGILLQDNHETQMNDEEEDETALESKNEKIKILIIEDNIDVRNFIHSELVQDYRIEEAPDGKKGLEKAFLTAPDLIISDVMMPEMDGTEVCRILKTDLRTSHIPVILLTAKSSPENQIQGLETGADVYITKPFNINVLKLQIRNILSYRATLRKRLIDEPLLDLKEITVTSTDEILIKKALQIVEENISNSEFNVNDFASAIGISRTLLYTKIKNITGQTINDFIQTIRLKRAADLLLKSTLNISEIGYDVGFNNPKYFSKRFKEYFGMHPSQFRESSKNTQS
jgi:signal transduction histidine kinase/ligand-binding sensor domain-containing protein/DNA-binding response OmpR family regulator